jgi:PAS domain S-box-containing protein
MPKTPQLIDEFDWASSSIGPREQWPQSLRTSVSICRDSRFPICLWWGADLIKIYNDAYRPILGEKHPRSFGAPGREVWPEIWHVIGPMLEGVMRDRVATWSDDQLLIIDRFGYPEECYFTFSYSPILDESGGVGGIFTAVTETTLRVIGERRLETLRRLAARANDARSAEEACRNSIEILETNRSDVPFAAVYLRRPDNRGSLIARSGDAPAPPAEITWTDAWRLWGDGAVALPLTIGGDDDAVGLLLAGVSRHRQLDDDYRGFFTLVAGHIASAVANARNYEHERQRAEELAELDRTKTAFFSNVSHEFRTPLTLMLGPIEELIATDHLSSFDRERLEVAHRNALRLLKLVNTLLDFSRIEASRIEAAYEPTDLATMTSDLAGVFRSAIERAGLRFAVDCPPLSQPVFVDREMWEKIVLNLLSNALKFTFEGEIEVTLRERERDVCLTVRDSGSGIPPDELSKVFDRFHRVVGARARTHEGSGIGLALARELVLFHGGSIEAESEVGRGTLFRVSIPLGSQHLPAERIGWSNPVASRRLRSDPYVAEAQRWVGGDPLTISAISGAPRILVADDNADMREYIHRLLADIYEVELVGDGLAALESARARPPDLLLSDVMMPGLDGFALLRALRSDERTRDVTVILLSARAGEESKIDGMEAGADDYLTKPFSARELRARVEAHLRLQAGRRSAQLALRESEAKFATAFGGTPLALTITSLDDGKLVEVNDGFIRLSGYSRQEVIGRSPEELGLWIQPEVRAERFEKLRRGLPVPNIEARFRIKSGEELIGMVGSALVEISGRPCVLSSVTDITERKRIEDALRASEARFREFADTAPAMLWITDSDGQCTFLSRGWYEYTGQTPVEALGEGWVRAVHPDDREATRNAFVEANIARLPFEVDYRIRRADGQYQWAIDSGRPRTGANGEYLGMIGSVIDISERKRAEQAKDEFLGTLSHELRTPLTSGFGWVKLLGRARDPELLDTGLAAIEQSFVNQMKLIDDLLDVSRIAAGKLQLELQPNDLGSVVESAISVVRPSAEAKGIDIRFLTRSVLSVRGDAARLRQVFWNLLSNAIKFTPAGGVVDVEVRQNEETAEVIVGDNGQGIEAKFLPHVFDRFRQADASITRQHGGLGIGLSIVASIVDAHGGTVRAESEGLGRGARFVVSLPLLAGGEAKIAPARGDGDGRDSLSGARVLVVDDDAATRRVIVATLEAAGADARPCSTAAEAHTLLSEWHPDVLISDLAMPDEDGYSLIRRIREAGHMLPALAITAYVRPEDEARVREAGFEHHVAKPFDPQELIRVVRQVSGRAGEC